MKRLVALAVLALAILIGWFAVAAHAQRGGGSRGGSFGSHGGAGGFSGFRGGSSARGWEGGSVSGRFLGPPRRLLRCESREAHAGRIQPIPRRPSHRARHAPLSQSAQPSSLPVCARQPVCTGHNAFHESRCAAGRTHYFQPAHALPTPHAVYRVQPSPRPYHSPGLGDHNNWNHNGGYHGGNYHNGWHHGGYHYHVGFYFWGGVPLWMAGDTLIFPVTCTIRPTTATTRTTTTPPRSLVTIPPPVPTIRRPIE